MDLGKMVDVAIGLSLMYLVLSLFCTFINEYISSVFSIRSKTLKSQLLKISTGSPEFVAVLAHPSIRSACIDTSKLSSAVTKAKNNTAAAQDALAKAIQAVANPSSSAILSDLNAAVQKATDLLAQAQDVEKRISEAQGGNTQKDQSYISSRAFASAMLDTINPNLQMSDTATYKAVINGIGTLPDGHLKDVLRSTVNNTTADIESVRDAIAHWFDTEMERVQGAYKRVVQWVALGVGLVLAVILNADTLQVAKVLWQDHALSAKVADSAGKFIEGSHGQTISEVVKAENILSAAKESVEAAQKVLIAAKAKVDAQGNATTPDAKTELENATNALQAKQAALTKASTDREIQIKAAQGNISAFKDVLAPLPIGWTEGGFDRWHRGLLAWDRESWLRLCGMILTGLALAMGAPFWFDTLNRFINIRSAGTKPATTAELQRAEKGAS